MEIPRMNFYIISHLLPNNLMCYPKLNKVILIYA
jgi:hypothetical protein